MGVASSIKSGADPIPPEIEALRKFYGSAEVLFMRPHPSNPKRNRLSKSMFMNEDGARVGCTLVTREAMDHLCEEWQAEKRYRAASNDEAEETTP